MFKFRVLTKPYLDYSFAPSRSLKCRVVERPGLWMPEAEWRKLLADIRLVGESNQEPLDYGILKGEKSYCENTVVTVVYDAAADRPVAFNAMSYMSVDVNGHKEDVIHLGLVMVDPAYRGKGFAWILYGLTCMLLFFRNLLNPVWISNVTQVPAVLGSVSENYDNVYPNPGKYTRRSFQHVAIAGQIMRYYRHVFGVGDDAEFDRERFVITNAYTGGSDGLKKSFARASKHRKELYNRACERELDYGRGDDFLQVGQINLAVARGYLLHKVPRGSLLAILYHAAFLLLSAVALPVIRWFASNRPMGELRPWKTR